MYDNSRQTSAVLPLVLSAVGAMLVRMVVRRIRGDRAAARSGAPTRGRGPAAQARRSHRGPVL